MAAPADAENDPGSHLAHNAEPTDEATVPTSHFEHAKDPAGAYLPGPQSVQSAAPANEYVPAPQLVQAAELVCAVKPENLPASQLSQAVLTPAAALYLPAAHTSQAVLIPAAALYLPASQLSHAVLTPDVALYLPASHSWHTFVLAPTTCEYFPALQSSQAADPDVSLNLPAMQNEQSPSGPV